VAFFVWLSANPAIRVLSNFGPQCGGYLPPVRGSGERPLFDSTNSHYVPTPAFRLIKAPRVAIHVVSSSPTDRLGRDSDRMGLLRTALEIRILKGLTRESMQTRIAKLRHL